MRLAKISLPACIETSTIVQVKEESLHLGLSNRSATYWPQPTMSGVQHPAQPHHVDNGSPVNEQSNHFTMPISVPHTQDDNGDPSMSVEADKSGRPKRKRIAPQQLETLLHLFQQTDTPSYEQREKVAGQLGMSNREVQVWFQNRRAKERNVKQKQQLIEQRERLDKVESASHAQDPATTPPFGPSSNTLHTASSPAYPTSEVLPSAFDGMRRRSLSTSALEYGPIPSSSNFTRTIYPQTQLESQQPFSIGPIRPRFSRHHTIHPQYSFGRPSSARSEMSISRSPPSRLQQLASTDLLYTSGGSVSNRREELMLPLPQPRYRFGHSPTSSFSNTRPSPSASGTIADRRENRLPPIRMLLDIADGALADLSPTLSQHPSSQSCSLYSPFSDLHLNTPGSQDGRRTDYFSARATQPTVGDNEALPSSQYTFGRNFQ